MTEKTHARYIGKDGAFVSGVPARDLTKEEWDRLDDDLQGRALKFKTHKLVSSGKKKSSKSAEEVDNG